MIKVEDLKKQQEEEKSLYAQFGIRFALYLQEHMKPDEALSELEVLKMYGDYANDPEKSKGLTELVATFRPLVLELRAKADIDWSKVENPPHYIGFGLDIFLDSHKGKFDFLVKEQLNGRTYYRLKE